MNIIEAMEDPYLFGEQFSDDSWNGWKALLAGFYGLPTNKEKYQQLTKLNSIQKAHDELWLVIGRRGGKSNIAALLAIYEAVFNDHAKKLSKGEVATVMVIAADRKQARSVMRYIRGLLIENPMLSQLISRESQDSIELTNRCVIEIMTATHRGTRGYTVAAAILDEIAFWHSEGANPDKEIIAALRPSLATLKGKLIALSSPYARRGVLWDNYKLHFGRNSRVLVAQAPSLMMNPTLPKHVVDEALSEDYSAAKAEYLAEFRTDVESYVSVEVIEACTRPSQLEILKQSGRRYFAFVDPSGGSADSFTMAVAHKEKEQIIIDVVKTTKAPFNPESVVELYCPILQSYNVKTVYGDAYAGEWPREQFRKRGVEYKKSDLSKSDLFRDLLPLLNAEKIQLPPLRELAKELTDLERKTSRAGRDIIDHPPNGHDDIANSVAGVAHIASKQCTINRVPVSFY